MPPLLEVIDLSVRFPHEARPALDRVSFSVGRGERVALVGESGAGKTSAALAILGLLGPGAVRTGTIRVLGDELDARDDVGLCRLRGRRIGMVFQDPNSTVNPVLTLGSQLQEIVALHTGLSGSALSERTFDWFERVGLPDKKRAHALYAHEMSGGMLQRAGIAMALAGEPELLIADEPTTALDATVQAGVLELLARLTAERSLGVLYIAHDLGVVAHFAERVLVLYAGRIVEVASVTDLFERAAHPYTRALLGALPSRRLRKERLPVLPHAPERLTEGACGFAAACPDHFERCRKEPDLLPVGNEHLARCWLAPESARTPPREGDP